MDGKDLASPTLGKSQDRTIHDTFAQSIAHKAQTNEEGEDRESPHLPGGAGVQSCDDREDPHALRGHIGAPSLAGMPAGAHGAAGVRHAPGGGAETPRGTGDRLPCHVLEP